MGRTRRAWVSQNAGSFHIISRIVGGEIILHDKEKEFFMELMERFASGFFVQIHAFCIMGNHFHILVTGLEQEAKKASKEELLKRYEKIYPKEPGRQEILRSLHPSAGRYQRTEHPHERR